jgi:hypothetical protein
MSQSQHLANAQTLARMVAGASFSMRFISLIHPLPFALTKHFAQAWDRLHGR